MRVSEGVLKGRIVELYNPEMFQEHEEVIVFTRDELNHFYNSMQQQINYISRIDLFLDRSEDWKLIGYWPKIMEKVNILDVNMDTILTKEPSIQTYLDAVLYNAIRSSSKNVAVSKKKVEVQLTLPI
ncbi:hypothetical protein [Methanobacterium sp. SMA-27]|uniref:hypothetical protein n=1 Tax=Methanobacterium sp. SMA-27 TaxID=1495336 RepID=UPI00064F1251|nr:hypothetical protein [Methanobacterium sp. SMA-27]